MTASGGIGRLAAPQAASAKAIPKAKRTAIR
jgi:hypothetical protein